MSKKDKDDSKKTFIPLNYEDTEDRNLQPWLKIGTLAKSASTFDEFAKSTLEFMVPLLKCKAIAVFYDPSGEGISETSLCQAYEMRDIKNTKAGKELVKMAQQVNCLPPDTPIIRFDNLGKSQFTSLARMYGCAFGAPIRLETVIGLTPLPSGAVIALWDTPYTNVMPAIQITEMLPNYANYYLKLPISSMLRPFIWTRSSQMMAVEDKVKKFAKTMFHIFILGERGTGKTALASEIHRQSGRPHSLFFAIPCSAYSSDVLEVVLFGCKKGAYTGADAERRGIFEDYDNGTVFLDEIGNIAPKTQEKLLHFLQTGIYTRYGDTVTKRSNTRLIFATNESLKDLAQIKSDGSPRLRKDFLDRIVSLSIVLPPLDDRSPEDKKILAQAFLDRCNSSHSVNIDYTENALNKLSSPYSYYGCANIHRLEKYVEIAFAYAFSENRTNISDGDIELAMGNIQSAWEWEPRKEDLTD